MADIRIVTLTTLRTRLLTTAQWCEDCLLPSAAHVELLLVVDDHPEPFYLTGDFCPHCARTDT